MTIKEKVINESIARIEKRLKEIKKINEATPILDLIKIREEAVVLFDENKTVEQRTSDEFLSKVKALAKKEKLCIKLAKEHTGQKMINLMDEEIALEFELLELKNERYFTERKQK
jgi:hypothetical protein